MSNKDLLITLEAKINNIIKSYSNKQLNNKNLEVYNKDLQTALNNLKLLEQAINA